MSMTNPTSSVLSRVYKMDNVLYEIRDTNGILNDMSFEPWKAEILGDLKSTGYIEERENKFVLTEEGWEVIRHDSFLNYDPNNKLEKPAEQAKYVLQMDDYTQFQNAYFLGGLVLVFLVTFGLAGLI